MKNNIVEALKAFSKTHLIIIAGFIALSICFMNPILDGKVLSQNDMTQYQGIKNELKKYHEESGEYSQWTNSQFNGMPAFHVGPTGARQTVFSHISRALRLGFSYNSPISTLLLYLFCFYILMQSLRLSP